MPLYTCEICCKSFKQKSELKRHKERKFPCKEDSKTKDKIILELKDEMVSIIKKHQEEINNLYKIIEEKNNEIQKLLKSKSYKNINNVTINVTTFCTENKRELNSNEIKTILNAGNGCFLSMIRHIHANDRLPHYKNICVTNLRSNGGYVFENNKWHFSDYDHLLYMLMAARMSDLDEFIKDSELVKNIRNISYVKGVLETYWLDSNKFVKENKQKIISLLYNYTKSYMCK